MKPNLHLYLMKEVPQIHFCLALEDYLLEQVDQHVLNASVFLWEPVEMAIVLGYSNVLEENVYVEHCQTDRIPVFRRRSGGGTVLLSKGCYCISWIETFSSDKSPKKINLMMLERIKLILAIPNLEIQGISDITYSGKKCVGSAQRQIKNAFLFHSSLLFDFDISKMECYLKVPKKQPEYRKDLPHREFITKLPFSSSEICRRFLQYIETKYDISYHDDISDIKGQLELRSPEYLVHLF